MEKIAYFLIYHPEHLKEEINRLLPDEHDRLINYHRYVINGIMKKYNNAQSIEDTKIHLFLNPDVGGLIQVGDTITPDFATENSLIGFKYMPKYMIAKGENETYLWNTGFYGNSFTIKVIDRRIDLINGNLSIVLRSVFY